MDEVPPCHFARRSAQKLNSLSLETLRIFLNYETNEFKLLQLVLLGQLELLPKVQQMKNLWDRISLKYVLNPLDELETKELIHFRLRQAGYDSEVQVFTDEAISAIYRYTQGYPRRIAMLCHNALKALVMENKNVIDLEIIQDLIARDVRVAV